MGMNDRHLPIAALLLGVCVLASALVLAVTWRGNIKVSQTLNVTGSAQMDITSDLGVVTCVLRGEGTTARAAFEALQARVPILESFLQSRNLTGDAVQRQAINSWAVEEFDGNGRQTGRILNHVYEQQFRIESPDVNLIKALSLDLAGLVTQGVDIRTGQPEYLYLKLADVKVEVQARAAHDAMERAQRIAAASGAKIGSIREAHMGVLQVTPRHSNEVSDYGINDNSSIDKQITAVVHAQFAIE
jgi:uncharacterized protein